MTLFTPSFTTDYLLAPNTKNIFILKGQRTTKDLSLSQLQLTVMEESDEGQRDSNFRQ